MFGEELDILPNILSDGEKLFVSFYNCYKKYQPSGEGGTRSLPATPHRLKMISGISDQLSQIFFLKFDYSFYYNLTYPKWVKKWPTWFGKSFVPFLLDLSINYFFYLNISSMKTSNILKSCQGTQKWAMGTGKGFWALR